MLCYSVVAIVIAICISVNINAYSHSKLHIRSFINRLSSNNFNWAIWQSTYCNSSDGLIPAAIDVDAMDEKTAKKYCGFLMNQNMMYMFQNQDLTSEIQAARSDVALHLQKITVLQSKLLEAHLLTEQIDGLKSTIILLQAENELLKAENKLLKDSLADYKTRIEVLEKNEEVASKPWRTKTNRLLYAKLFESLRVSSVWRLLEGPRPSSKTETTTSKVFSRMAPIPSHTRKC